MNKQFSQSLSNAVSFFQQAAKGGEEAEQNLVGAKAAGKGGAQTLHLKITPPVVQKLRDNEQLKLLAAKQKTESDIWLKKLSGQNRDLMHKITEDVWSKL